MILCENESFLYYDNSLLNLICENLFFLSELFFILEHLFFFMRNSFLFESMSYFSWKLFFIRKHLFFFMKTFFYFCLYENKQTYKSHHLKQILFHQNMIMIFCRFCMFQTYDFLAWIPLILCLSIFFIKQRVFKFIKLSCNIYSFCRIKLFTINIFMENVFDFNPTNSLIIFPSDSSFILPITFYWSHQNTLNLLNSY